MRNSLRQKILFYLAVWAGLFVLLCVVSLVKNADLLMAALSNALGSMIVWIAVIGLMIYGIALLLRAAWR